MYALPVRTPVLDTAQSPAFSTSATAVFDPATTFGGSDRGFIFDLVGTDNIAQNTAGTTPVTTAGQPIAYARDLGPMGRNATQATAANQFVYRGTPRTLGSEAVTNGRFAADTDWTKGTGWVIALGVATKAAGVASTLSQAITLTPGYYQLIYLLTRTAGTCVPQFTGGTTVSATSRAIGGSYIEILLAVSGNTTLEFSADSSFVGTVSNVTMAPITAFSTPCAWTAGSPQQLATAAIDCSNSDKFTLAILTEVDQVTASRIYFALGNYATTVGSIWAGQETPPAGYLKGPSAAPKLVLPTSNTEGPVANSPMMFYDYYEFDLAGVTVADEIKIWTRKNQVTGTATGSAAGGGNLVNGTVLLGRASWKGLWKRCYGINRILNATEKAGVDSWMTRDHLVTACIGDSTIAPASTAVLRPNASSVSSLVGGLICNRADIATSGHKIADQLTLWTALPGKTALQCVIVQVGLNDIKSRIGANTATTATVLADLQSFITTIRADIPSTAKIYVAGLTPCKVWLDAATNPSAAYQGWLDINDAIAGNGGSPITGVDGRITAHVALLNDGSGNLKAIYDYNADGVHESNEARFLIAMAWRTALEAGNLLT